ncbi:hypothetical protein HRbin17_01492 [bacterium HR17]|jgi:hypothetical protein|uniref:DUF2905 domain-containing protein n=1 Tax=Candidatus Fervidibacter japonicus TaxID=2035412 RepID=A0A2H5XCR7_9BACT|nr:hypothetical protein HRbin17_01492 [bacterium HR17]
MNGLDALGKLLIGVGALLIVAGAIALALSKWGVGWKPLPGDIVVRRDNFTFYAPIATSLLISLVLSAVLTLLAWLWRR